MRSRKELNKDLKIYGKLYFDTVQSLQDLYGEELLNKSAELAKKEKSKMIHKRHVQEAAKLIEKDWYKI